MNAKLFMFCAVLLANVTQSRSSRSSWHGTTRQGAAPAGLKQGRGHGMRSVQKKQVRDTGHKARYAGVNNAPPDQ